MKKSFLVISIIIAVVVNIVLFPFYYVIYHRIIDQLGYVDYFIPRYKTYLRLTSGPDHWYVGISKDPEALKYIGKCPDTVTYFSVNTSYNDYEVQAYFNTEKFDTLWVNRKGEVSPYNFSGKDNVIVSGRPPTEFFETGSLAPSTGYITIGLKSICPRKIEILLTGENLELVEIKRRLL